MALTRVRWRLSLTLLCLLASTFQSSLALTHVHTELDRAAVVAAALGSAAHSTHRLASDAAAPSGLAADQAGALLSADEHSTQPSQNHAGNVRENAACPLCQILMFGGGLPTAPYQMPVRFFTAAVHLPLEQVPACFIAAVSYAWQSRGPPRI